VRREVGVAAAAAFAALAGLVASGAVTGFDQWANTHAMPFAGKPGPPPTLLESLVPLLHADLHPDGLAAAAIVTLPGQILVSLLLILVAAWKLRARGRLDTAAGWIAAWLVGSAVEVLCKHVLTRPPLHRNGVHVIAFDSSWPSGHVLRCAVVACALAAAWPRFRGVLGVWLTAAAVLLELAGAHTPTDLIGGLLLAAVAAVGAAELERSGLLGRRAALRRPGPRAAG
jgi:membrane-associated phospholipid phosphatase